MIRQFLFLDENVSKKTTGIAKKNSKIPKVWEDLDSKLDTVPSSVIIIAAAIEFPL